jgi:ankyrin repeat protein
MNTAQTDSPRRALARGHTGMLALGMALTLTIPLTGCGDSAQDRQAQGMALLQIAEDGRVSALDALLERDIDINYRDSCDWTPLMKAALNGHTASVSHLLDAGAEVDAADKGGYTGLMLAASNNHVETVELLIDRGAMIDAKEHTQGFTALIWAAQRGHREVVELLLARGADRTLPDFEGKTAAERAAEQGQAHIQALLAEQRPAATAANGAGTTPSTTPGTTIASTDR